MQWRQDIGAAKIYSLAAWDFRIMRGTTLIAGRRMPVFHEKMAVVQSRTLILQRRTLILQGRMPIL
ncbi:MAG TPA: hypothetical protein VMB22_01795 [Verrucomicrobiae bacterium]|nr:hypothetical protein [Verrucomicrobiae bacterium]